MKWKGGGGFRYYKLAPSLLEKDKWGNWVVNKQYNAAMLAEAICKLEGFTYAPSDSIYWQHGHSMGQEARLDCCRCRSFRCDAASGSEKIETGALALSGYEKAQSKNGR